MSRDTKKQTNWVCAQRRLRSAGVRPVWSESSLSAWRNLGPLATHWVHSEDSGQTGRMSRLIWVFAGQTLILLVLSCRGSYQALVYNFCHEFYENYVLGHFEFKWIFNAITIPIRWASSWENLFMPYANNKGADQPSHPRSLISNFVFRCLDSIISLVSTSEISSLYLAFVAAQAGSSLTWSKTPKTGFLVTRLRSVLLLINNLSYAGLKYFMIKNERFSTENLELVNSRWAFYSVTCQHVLALYSPTKEMKL